MKLTTSPEPPENPEPSTDFYIGFTSGSSGKPKGFTRSHGSWIESFKICEDAFNLSKENVILSPGPLCHSLSLFTAIHSIHLGSTLHVAEEFERGELVNRMNEEQIDTFVGVPTMVESIMDGYLRLNKTNSYLKNLIVSGAGWSETSKGKAEIICPSAFKYEYYGASELSFVMYKEGKEQGHKPFSNVFINVKNEAGRNTGKWRGWKVVYYQPNAIYRLYKKQH